MWRDSFAPVHDRKNDFPWTRWRSGTKKKEKRKRKLFPRRKRATRSNRLLRLHLTIELSRIWIELRDRSLGKNLRFFVKDGELLRFRNVGLGLERNTEDSRDNRHDRYDFSSFSKVVNEKAAEMFYEQYNER